MRSARLGIQPDSWIGHGGAHMADQHPVGVLALIGEAPQAGGDSQPRGQVAASIPVDDCRYCLLTGKLVQWCSTIRVIDAAASGTQQPAVQPVLFDAWPRQ